VAEEKEKLIAKIESHGGEFAGAMEQDITTHLIANPGDHQSLKYKAAMQWNLPVVTPRWIDDTIQNGRE